MECRDCILFSGGAAGAEAEFGACAERHGIEEVNFTFEGHPIVRHRGVRVLNHEELQSGDVSLAYVSRLMHRRYADAPTSLEQARELGALAAAGAKAVDGGLALHAGHGLNYQNVGPIARIAGMAELNIGHSIVSRAVMVGMERAVREMKEAMRMAERPGGSF